MVTASKFGAQDLPPEGGYSPIHYERVKLKLFFKGKKAIAIVAGMSLVSTYLYALNYYQVKRDEVEMRSARNAIIPLIWAEKDRAMMKQLRKNRDAEERLMKNHEGWEVGTYYGDRVYITEPKEKLIMPTFREYFSHCHPADGLTQRLLRTLLT